MSRAKRQSAKSSPPSARDASIVHAIERWFLANARELPWRRVTATVNGVPQRDPYHALVSEIMLQQTQVSRVIDRYQQFIKRFPTVTDLAKAPQDDVLELWAGLGYYRRARSLHAAAKHVVDRHASVFPTTVDEILELPGVGRYTAGAIASMALGQRVPLADGNVGRVLLRIDANPARQGDPKTDAWVWSRAESLVAEAKSPGAFNEGLMELGALVCVPGAPACELCPVRSMCRAYEQGVQDQLPTPKKAPVRKPIFCDTILFEAPDGLLAVEQRGPHGMWAGLWQAPTSERTDRMATKTEVIAWARTLGVEFDGARMKKVRTVEVATTHRDLTFRVWRCPVPRSVGVGRASGWRWAAVDAIAEMAISSAQRRVILGSDPR